MTFQFSQAAQPYIVLERPCLAINADVGAMARSRLASYPPEQGVGGLPGKGVSDLCAPEIDIGHHRCGKPAVCMLLMQPKCLGLGFIPGALRLDMYAGLDRIACSAPQIGVRVEIRAYIGILAKKKLSGVVRFLKPREMSLFQTPEMVVGVNDRGGRIRDHGAVLAWHIKAVPGLLSGSCRHTWL